MIRNVVAAALLTVAYPALAQVPDPLTQVTDPAERALSSQVAAAVAAESSDLERLDALLAQLPRPTTLRGLVQTARAIPLSIGNRDADALRAVEEGLTLLPGHPYPMMVATYVMTFGGAPQRGADLWLQASTVDPAVARHMDSYVLAALVGRLRDAGDGVRADKVEARMGEIGFATLLAPARSATALAQVRLDVAAGRGDVALGAVSSIAAPADLLALYVDRRYEALWPRIAEWGGAGLQDQARRYLEDLRREWAAAGDLDSATNYARALAAAREYQTVVTLFLPLLERSGIGRQTEDVEFLTPVVARSLAKLGRRAEADALVTRIGATFAGDTSGRAFNFSGSVLSRAYDAERWADAVTLATAFMQDAAASGPTVNDSAALQVRHLRGCALWKLGRRDEAEGDMAAVLLARAALPDVALRVYQCRDEVGPARDLLVASLAGERQRSWALTVLQPQTLPADATAEERAAWQFRDMLRRDPKVVAAANKVGRILPEPIPDTLPQGFDPFAAQPGTVKPGSI